MEGGGSGVPEGCMSTMCTKKGPGKEGPENPARPRKFHSALAFGIALLQPVAP